MTDSKIDNEKKWGISLYSAILFLVIASPILFKLVNNLTVNFAGVSIVNENGCPNIIGLILHALVFMIIVRLSMEY